MNELKYFIYLQMLLGQGNRRAVKILERYGSAEAVYRLDNSERKESGLFTERELCRFETLEFSQAEKIYSECKCSGIELIPYGGIRYPDMLAAIDNPPLLLYIKGQMPEFDSIPSICVVGPRRVSEYGKKSAFSLGYRLAKAGMTVVSGGALGSDFSAHSGALKAGGRTVLVMGCGINSGYLPEAENLRKAVAEKGCLISEYPPYARAAKYSFPLRNRIMSALSLGTAVVEAPKKSGALITASFALEQGRDVYAVPSSVLSVDFAGTNKLIDDGAIVATKPAQIAGAYAEKFDTIDMSKARSVEELMTDESDKSANVEKDENALSFEKLEENREKRLENEKIAAGLTGDVKTVYNCLSDCFVHIDTVIEKTGLPGASVMASVTQLEVLGLVQSTSGKRYKLS